MLSNPVLFNPVLSNLVVSNVKKHVSPLIGVALVFLLPGAAAAVEPVDPVAKGQYLAAAGGCQACHTDTKKDSIPFAGGRPLKTPFGTFYTPNITADQKTGLGMWQDKDFVTALKEGLSPSGSHYFPAFPYTSYTKMTDEDALSIFAFLKSLPTADQKNKDHDVSAPFSWRWLQWGWKQLFFKQGDYVAPPNATAAAIRGGYLVEALGHCGECHSPRNALGGIDGSMKMAGARGGGEGELVSNITPDVATGIGDWSAGDIASFLESGMKPNFDDVQGSMEEVIAHGTSKLSSEDRAAIADYLLSLKPISNKIGR